MIDVTSKNLNIQLSADENMNAYLSGGNLQAVLGKTAEINAVSAVSYIKSGKKEIDEAVEGCIEVYNNNANSKTSAFNDNAIAKTSDFNIHAADSIAKAEYWAEQAAYSVANTANKDLNNLTVLGELRFSAKQDVISDLTTIRSGAALGTTALQSGDNISDLTNDSGFITSSALSGYATENYVDTGLSAKQEALVSGTNIKTVNGNSLLGSGDLSIDLSGKADIDLSNINASGKSLASGLSMPSSRTINLTLGASGSTYTAPASGLFAFRYDSSSGAGFCQLQNDTANIYVVSAGTVNSVIIPVRRGDNISAHYNNVDTFGWFQFNYAQGEI